MSGKEMKRRQREAIVAAIDQRLAERGSWCGETHLQKAVYFLQTLLGVPTGFSYILYKFGPFSRELRTELGSMRADGFLELVPQPEPYGPTLQTTEVAEQQLLGRWPKTIRRYDPALDFVAKTLGGLGVGELERLATALWVREEDPEAQPVEQAERIHELKPHVSSASALKAVQKVAKMTVDAADLT
jgi:hypothetical protein